MKNSYDNTVVSVSFTAPPFGPYDYILPHHFSYADIGFRVEVPLGKREVIGIIVATKTSPPADIELKIVIDVPDISPYIPASTFELIEFTSRYYACSLGECIRLAMPQPPAVTGSDILFALPNTSQPSESDDDIIADIAKVGWLRSDQIEPEKRIEVATALKNGLLAVENVASQPDPDSTIVGKTEYLPDKINPKSKLLLSTIGDDTITLKQLKAKGFKNPHIRKALSLGIIYVTRRKAVSQADIIVDDYESAKVVMVRGGTPDSRLNFVTLSVNETVKAGGDVLIIVPTVYRVPVVAKYFAEKGIEVSQYTSGYTPAARYLTFKRVNDGFANVIIGTRSALFLSFPNLKLIAVIDESDYAHKQRKITPFYNSREMALVAARPKKASVILTGGSASAEAYQAISEGRWESISLSEKTTKVPIYPVGMGNVIKDEGEKTVISEKLQAGMKRALDRDKAVLLFINRRGYIPLIYCGNCGFSFDCPNCDVGLVYHKTRDVMLCHYCGRVEPLPERCPECHKESLLGFGVGVEKVADEAHRLFPNFNVVQVHSDSIKTSNKVDRFFTDFDAGRGDIIVGTAMALRAVFSPRIGTVGLVSADAALVYSDFRASERTFQTIRFIVENVAQNVEVVLQTFYSRHFAIQTALENDEKAFWDRELPLRERLDLPPYSRLVAIFIESFEQHKAEIKANKILGNVRSIFKTRANYEGPTLAPISRIRNKYRYQILIETKAPYIYKFGNELAKLRTPGRKRGASVKIVVDPVDFF